ncbi:MAG TPA: hypothetical protein DDZ89_17515 [Clostridiales bacterium]|nr:hypothetical protein [Clostridiales bacterium]
MLKETIKSIPEFFSTSLSGQDKTEFMILHNRINVVRLKITATAFIILEIIMLSVYFIVTKGDLLDHPDKTYGWMYISMLVVMSIFLLIFIHLGKNVVKHGFGINCSGILFSIFILAWCAGISLLDQLSNGQVIVYVVAIISIAVTPILHPFILFFMYIVIHTAFLVLLPRFQSSSELLFTNSINSTSFLVISWAISLMRYKRSVEEFKIKKILQVKSYELEQMNKELEATNLKLETLSQTDALTGVSNRLMFGKKMEAEWNRCKRYSIPLTLIFVDIDNFKTFNDLYGHLAGDQCIKQVANALSACAQRSFDMVSRYGGDEFVMVLPHLTKDDALILADQVKKRVEEAAVPHLNSAISDHVTVSLGVHTIIPSDETSIYEFIRRTDNALYKAKERRNCICSAP